MRYFETTVKYSRQKGVTWENLNEHWLIESEVADEAATLLAEHLEELGGLDVLVLAVKMSPIVAVEWAHGEDFAGEYRWYRCRVAFAKGGVTALIKAPDVETAASGARTRFISTPGERVVSVVEADIADVLEIK